jgi:hypothetical protein
VLWPVPAIVPPAGAHAKSSASFASNW